MDFVCWSDLLSLLSIQLHIENYSKGEPMGVIYNSKQTTPKNLCKIVLGVCGDSLNKICKFGAVKIFYAVLQYHRAVVLPQLA